MHRMHVRVPAPEPRIRLAKTISIESRRAARRIEHVRAQRPKPAPCPRARELPAPGAPRRRQRAVDAPPAAPDTRPIVSAAGLRELAPDVYCLGSGKGGHVR